MSEGLLRRRRVRVGLTQAAVAAALGVSQQTIARWESGRTPPSRYLRELSELLELPVAELLNPPTGKNRAGLSRLAPLQAGAAPFGTVRLDLMPRPEEEWLTASERAQAQAWTPYEYPVSEQTRKSLATQLTRREPELSWLWFASLDNRIVLANLHLLEVVALISNGIEEMPAYRPAAVYEAIGNPTIQALLAADPEPHQAAASGTVPDDLVSACRSYLDESGGLEAAIAREREIVIETARGYRDALPLDSDQTAAHAIQALLLALTRADHRSAAGMQDWLLNLHADGPDRATHYRLGALALIDAPATAITSTTERAAPRLS